MLTAHDILPREARPGQRKAQRRLYDRFDAIVVHSEHGRLRLTGELGVEPERVHVIPHGVLEHLASGGPDGGAADDGAAAAHPPLPSETQEPVVLCFGLMRPYKGIDLLLEAWRGIEGAELWIAGMPRMDISRAAARPRHRACASCRASSATTSCPRTSAAPTWSCSPTARSTSRACCSRRSRSASRCC